MTRDPARASGTQLEDTLRSGADGLRRRRHEPRTSPTRRSTGHVRARRRKKFFQPHKVERDGDGDVPTRPRGEADGFFTSYDDGGRFVTYYGDNHPRYAGNVVKAMASAKDGYPHVVALFADELAALERAEQPARDAASGDCWRRSTTSWSRASSASSA